MGTHHAHHIQVLSTPLTVMLYTPETRDLNKSNVILSVAFPSLITAPIRRFFINSPHIVKIARATAVGATAGGTITATLRKIFGHDQHPPAVCHVDAPAVIYPKEINVPSRFDMASVPSNMDMVRTYQGPDAVNFRNWCTTFENDSNFTRSYIKYTDTGEYTLHGVDSGTGNGYLMGTPEPAMGTDPIVVESTSYCWCCCCSSSNTSSNGSHRTTSSSSSSSSSSSNGS